MSIKKKQLYQSEALIEIMNSILPSGFVGWFKRTTAPEGWAICDGRTVTLSDGSTTKTPNLVGRYVLGATSGIGSQVEAGLPNITGMFSVNNKDGAGRYNVAGAFTKTNPGFSTSASARVGDDGNADYTFPIYFNASLSSAVYGKSSTVTPPSTKLLPCMKL